MENSNELYDSEAFPGMTVGDANRINNLNRRNGYGLTRKELSRIIQQHKKARAAGDYRTMSVVEYRLTDINYHIECSLLSAGKYEELKMDSAEEDDT